MLTEQLYIDCQKQKRQAQKQLYEYLAPRLYPTCKRYLQQDADIDDALSEAFFIIFTKIDQLKDYKLLEAWARKIAVRECLSVLRKRIHFLETNENDNMQLPQLTVEPDMMEAKDLMKLLEALPEGSKVVFSLFVIEGYAHREIAEMLHISEGTSKSQLNYAKTKLRTLVTQYYYLKQN